MKRAWVKEMNRIAREMKKKGRKNPYGAMKLNKTASVVEQIQDKEDKGQLSEDVMGGNVVVNDLKTGWA